MSLLLVLSGLSVALAAPLAPHAGIVAQTTPSLQRNSLPLGRGSGGVALPQEVEPGLRLVESDEHGVVLELRTPEFQAEQGMSDSGPCHLIAVADYGETDAAGWPRLPVKGAMVGIPPQADLTLTVLEADTTVAPERYDLCPVPRPIVEMDASGEISYRGVEALRDAEAYGADTSYPASLAEIVSTGFLRSQRVAQLRFHPFQYNPVSGELRYHRRIRVRLDFVAGGGPLPLAGSGIEEGSFEDILRHIVVNYDAARRWRARPEAPVTQAVFPSQSEPSYKILVDEDGIYQVTYAELQAAGVEVEGVDPRTFQLFNGGEEVAIHVDGEADGSFDSSDVLLFYGQRLDTKYTDTNVYWLTWGETDGLRMPGADGSPGDAASFPERFLTTQRTEDDLVYQSHLPSGPENDNWYWSLVTATGTPVAASYTTTLPHPATEPLSATVRALFRGYTASPEHHTQIYLNGHLLDEAAWPSQTEYYTQTTIPQGYLIEGTNTISVVAGISNTLDMIFVNWFEIDYHAAYEAEDDLLFFDGDQAGTWEYRVNGFTTATLELFDITTPTTPTRILSATVEPGGTYTLTFGHTITEEHHYLALTPARRSNALSIEEDVLSDLQSTANGADYVIITHGDFYTAVLPLAEYRTAEGLRTVVVDGQDVYDEFSYGIFDPEAIRDFLAYAYDNWVPPAPAYVLLVGDGNYDPKDNLGWGEPNYILPYLYDVDPWLGETAADNRYVCVSGDDILPDMHIGRLPVKTSAEANTMVAKILGYEQNPPGGDWSQRALFVADNPDSAGDFYALSDAIADNYLPAPYTAQKVYYGLTHPTPAEARAAIINAINEGQLLVNYVGHGAFPRWAVEQLLHRDDVAALANAGRLPLMVPMTCLEGWFIYPSPPGSDRSSLGESIVRASGGGAIASWSPTGAGVATGHDFLNKGLFEAIFFDDVIQLGAATTQAKLYLYGNTGGYRDLIDTYVLFGDPAGQFNALRADVGIAKAVDPPGLLRPGDAITYTLTYSNAGPATARHIVISDGVPTTLLSPTVVSAGAVITPRVGSRFVWDVADLAEGEGGTITITAMVSPTFTGVLSNTAAIATTGLETDTGNNVAGPVFTGVDVPDLVIGAQGPAEARVGSIITYTLVYSNAGLVTAHHVVITDVLPTALLSPTVVSAGAVITPRVGSRFVWDVADLSPGEGGIITITATLSPTFGGLLTNTATIATADSEASQANNIATLVTLVQHRVYLPLLLRDYP